MKTMGTLGMLMVLVAMVSPVLGSVRPCDKTSLLRIDNVDVPCPTP
jgi:hypothetical protein